MDEEQFRRIVSKYLVPMFSGALLEAASEPSVPAEQCAAYRDPCTIALKPTQASPYRILVHRSQVFAPAEGNVFRTFATVLGSLMPTLGTPAFQDLLTTFSRRVVARIVSAANEDVLLRVFDQFNTWSTRQYEGKPISACVGVDPAAGPGDVALTDVWLDDYSAVLTNGVDTLLAVSPQGNVLRYEALPYAGSPSFAPDRFRAVASWATGDRVAVCLTRSGEILVFQGEQLVFARRGGVWHFLTHEPILPQMRCPQSLDVRRAVYESCLDSSFARTGACIGVVTSNNRHRVSQLVAPRDRIHLQQSTKTKLMNQVIGAGFHQVDRRLRQELLAIDGATVIDHEGHLLAVGAIVDVEAGSAAGGRLAAAQALSSLGLGIKISQDGGIKGYRPNSQGNAELAFAVC